MSHEGTSSDLSYTGTGGEIRYKKALKQISKLVSMNTTLKKQLQATRQNMKKMEEEYYKLMEKFEELNGNMVQNTPIFLNKEFRYPDQNGDISQVNRSKDSFHHVDQNAIKTFEQNYENLKAQKYRLEENQVKLKEQIKYLEERVLNFEHKVQEKEQIIHQLESAIEKKHIQIIQMEGRCGDLNEQVLKLTNLKQQENSIAIAINEQLAKQRQKVQQLESKFKKSEAWANSLASQFEQLRKTVVLNQKSADSFTGTSLYLPNIPRSNSYYPQISKKNSHLPNSTTLQKQKLLQQQLNKLHRQYADKKMRYKNQIVRLKQQVEILNERIYSMNIFITKQQFYIQNYVAKAEQNDEYY